MKKYVTKGNWSKAKDEKIRTEIVTKVGNFDCEVNGKFRGYSISNYYDWNVNAILFYLIGNWEERYGYEITIVDKDTITFTETCPFTEKTELTITRKA